MANRFWVGGTGTWNTTTTHWSATDGGAAGAVAPTTSDDVFFTASSGGGTVTVSGNRSSKSITCTGYTGTFTTTGSLSDLIFVAGSVLLVSGMTVTALNLFMSGTGSITSAGKTISNIDTSGSGASVTLVDALVLSGTLTISIGTFNASNQNVTAAAVNGSSTSVRTITMGSGTWSLTGTGNVWDTGTTTNLTLTPNTSTIKVTDTSASAKLMDGGSKTFNNLWVSGASSATFTLAGSNTFADIKANAPITLIFSATHTQTVTSLTMVGSFGSLVTMQSSLSGTAWTLSCASGAIWVNYCSIKDSHASGGATFTAANSTNVSGNTGWRFFNQSTGMFAAF